MSSFIKNILNHNKNNRERIQTISITFVDDEVINSDSSKLDNKILYKVLSSKKQEELTRLDYSINNLSMTYKKIHDKHDKRLKQLEDELKAKYECSICMEKSREFVCVPCGHSYCEECCRKMKDGICFTCRERVNFFQKLY